MTDAMDVDDDVRVELQGGDRGRSCFALEFPGYIDNVDRALETLGGMQGLQEQRKAHPKRLTLKLRPKDDYCHPLVSNDVKKSSMMLLRLDMMSGTSSVYTIPQVFHFHSPADMQMQDRSRCVEDETVSCIPPVFQIEGPVEYAVDAYGSGREMNAQKYARMGYGAIVLDYGIPHVPKDTEGFFGEGFQDTDTRLTTAGHCLRKLFKSRPVYMNGALGMEMRSKVHGQSMTDEDVNEQLSILCYRFASGPWRSSWIRKGYDPRKDIQAGKYHVISLGHMTLGSSDEEDDDAIDTAVPADMYDALCSLDASKISKYPQRIHLMDIEDAGIQHRLEKSIQSPSRVCTEECGWHVEFSLSKLCDKIQEILHDRGGSDLSVEYHETKTRSPVCLDPFSSQELIVGVEGKRGVLTKDSESPGLFDILPDEYYESISSALSKKDKK